MVFKLANLTSSVKITRMYSRNLLKKIEENLLDYPSVAILGPRQIGKTTLAWEISKSRESVYLDLENPQDFQKLKDPNHYFELHKNKLIILDEIQRYPELFRSLRGVIDSRRRDGITNGSFLILGSASNELLHQSSESLAGRISYLELTGLKPQEVKADNPETIRKLWLRGGFPDSYQARSDQKSNEWRTNFIKTYVERDIPQMGSKVAASTMLRFWTMLAHSQGEILNASKLGSSLGVSSVSVSRYLDMMVDLLLVRRLEPWFENTKKRLVKSPRIYIRDSGIVHSLLQIPDYESLLSHPVYGKSWEGFVIEMLISQLATNQQAYFYRTSAGAEIDLVLKHGYDVTWAIEIKASYTPTVSKGFHIACDDLGASRKLVIYPGEESFSLGNDVMAVSLETCMRELQS